MSLNGKLDAACQIVREHLHNLGMERNKVNEELDALMSHLKYELGATTEAALEHIVPKDITNPALPTLVLRRVVQALGGGGSGDGEFIVPREMRRCVHGTGVGNGTDDKGWVRSTTEIQTTTIWIISLRINEVPGCRKGIINVGREWIAGHAMVAAMDFEIDRKSLRVDVSLCSRYRHIRDRFHVDERSISMLWNNAGDNHAESR